MRIGVFGGTFDPPHLGHLILAAEAFEQLELDRILWVLTPDPPHKLGKTISPLPVRLQLLEAALGDEPKFEISRLDIDRPGPQFAVDTVQLLAREVAGSEIYYLIGGDSLRDLPTWRNPQQLIQRVAGLGVMRRPGDDFDLEQLEQVIPGLKARLHFFEAPLLEISSSQIRQRIQQGRTYRYYLPIRVYEMIEERGLYRYGEEQG